MSLTKRLDGGRGQYEHMRIATLPDETQVYCGHEYTQSNARFALTIDPENAALKQRAREIDALGEDCWMPHPQGFAGNSMLPLVAVERIEVLKDGASAVYGSDAVAGVVNIITRQNFEGAEIGGSFGGADQGGLHEQNLKFVGGLGDIDKDGYNILFSLQGYNRERLDQDERNLTKSGIYSDQPGGRWNGWSAKGARYLVNGVSVPMLDANGNCPTGTTRVATTGMR